MKNTRHLSMALKGCMILFFVLFSLDLSAQIVVKGKNLSAVEAIKQIEKSSDWTFIYNSSEICLFRDRCELADKRKGNPSEERTEQDCSRSSG